MERDTKQFSILHPLVLSFYSKALYRDVARRWQGTGLGYLLLLLAVSWVPVMVSIQVGIERFSKQVTPAVLEQIPPITISQGQVSTNVQTPYFIRDKNGTALAIIDLTGKYTSLENTTARLLLTRNRLFARGEGGTRSVDLGSIRRLHIDRDWVQRWLAFSRNWLTVILFPVLLFFSYIYRVVEVLLYALLGMVFAALMKTALDYRALLRLAIVAITPAVIIGTLHSLRILEAPHLGLISFLIAMSYLLFGVWANTDGQGTEPEQPTTNTPG